jgi:hypothetical protein
MEKSKSETETKIPLTYEQIEGVFGDQAKTHVNLGYYDYWLTPGYYSGDDEEKIYTSWFKKTWK